MVPNSWKTDGGDLSDPGFDKAALYTVVRDAVKDALLDVIGTVLLLGIAFVLVIAGIGRIFVNFSRDSRYRDWSGRCRRLSRSCDARDYPSD
ncbi:putative membrane protein (plasmid) [Haloferax volcanii]|nr:putative membrane protein [Haloferax lucentense]